MASDTRPGEVSRIARDEYEFRVEVLQGQTRIETLLQSHIADDQRQFTELRQSLGSVSSGINDYQDVKGQAIGAKKLLMGAVAIVAALGGCILFVLEVLRFAGKGAP